MVALAAQEQRGSADVTQCISTGSRWSLSSDAATQWTTCTHAIFIPGFNVCIFMLGYVGGKLNTNDLMMSRNILNTH